MPDYPKDDCYDALGVDHEASQDLIHTTYIKLVKIYHPDPLNSASSRDRAAAQEKLKRINEAYEILKDPVRRQNYDDWKRQKRQPPRPRVTPDELDFGTLDPDQSRTIRLTVENDGGPVTGEINFSMSRDPSYFRLGVNPSSGFPLLVDVTFDGSSASGDFADSLTVTLDGVAAHASLRVRVRSVSAPFASAAPFAAPHYHSAGTGATPPPYFVSSPAAPPSSPSGLSRGWAIALGWIVFVIILFFGEAIAQNVARLRPQPPDWLPGATFYSLFGAAVLAGVMTTGMLRARRTRAVIAAALAVASGVTFFILLGVGISQPASTPGKPNLSPAVVEARAGERPPILDCGNLSLRLYNIDDSMQASLTNAVLGSQLILQIPERQDTGFVDLSSRTQPGINTLSLLLMNYRGGYTYGYQLRSNSTIVDQAACGQVGIRGCNNNDLTTGPVFKHAFSFECPGATQQAADAKTSDGEHNADVPEASKPTLSDTPDDANTAVQSPVSLDWQDISFSIGPCSTRADSVVCATRILNNGDDRRIRLGLARDSRIIDDTGHEFPVNGGELGANNCRGCDVSSTLVRGVPIAGSVSFSRRNRATGTDVNSAISAIAVLELRANIEERGWNTLQFRDVPLHSAGTAAQRKPAPADAVDDGKADTAESAVTRNLEGIFFSIGPCSARSDSVVCATRILNKGTDRRIRLGLARDSRIIDEAGHEFPVIGGELGANSCRGCDVSSNLVGGVPIVGSVGFGDPRRNRATVTDVKTAISAIAVLELRVNIEERGWNTLQFRNVPISK